MVYWLFATVVLVSLSLVINAADVIRYLGRQDRGRPASTNLVSTPRGRSSSSPVARSMAGNR